VALRGSVCWEPKAAAYSIQVDARGGGRGPAGEQQSTRSTRLHMTESALPTVQVLF